MFQKTQKNKNADSTAFSRIRVHRLLFFAMVQKKHKNKNADSTALSRIRVHRLLFFAMFQNTQKRKTLTVHHFRSPQRRECKDSHSKTMNFLGDFLGPFWGTLFFLLFKVFFIIPPPLLTEARCYQRVLFAPPHRKENGRRPIAPLARDINLLQLLFA